MKNYVFTHQINASCWYYAIYPKIYTRFTPFFLGQRG